MGELGNGRITKNMGFVNLETLLNVNLIKDNNYYLQILNRSRVRRGENGIGFLWDSNVPFEFTYNSENIYIKVDKENSFEQSEIILFE